MTSPTRPPSIERTPPLVLAVAGLLGGGVTWLLVNTVEYLGQSVPRVTAAVPILIAVIAAIVGTAAAWAHRRIQVLRTRIDPDRAITLLVLGKTALIGGAALAAGYATVALLFVADWEASLARERVVNSSLAAAAAAALAVAGWFLERACIVPHDPDAEAPGQGLGEAGTHASAS